MQIRTPAVAGMFYPNKKNELEQSIKSLFLHKLGPGKLPPTKTKKRIYGVICPHAGYMYSGPIACQSYYAISSDSKKIFVIIGPNHWGIGSDIAIMKDGVWQTPLGEVEIDTHIAEEISKAAGIAIDSFSHSREHSIEVQIPILQTIKSDCKIVPIVLIDQSIETAVLIGKTLAKIAKTNEIMIIGSSDFTHYETDEFAREQDLALIEPILNLDVEEFYNILQKRNVSACGYGAIASVIVACKEIGATKGELLKYATSGEVTDDLNSVVGYGSIIFT